jgi:hypothetical protein
MVTDDELDLACQREIRQLVRSKRSAVLAIANRMATRGFTGRPLGVTRKADPDTRKAGTRKRVETPVRPRFPDRVFRSAAALGADTRPSGPVCAVREPPMGGLSAPQDRLGGELGGRRAPRGFGSRRSFVAQRSRRECLTSRSASTSWLRTSSASSPVRAVGAGWQHGDRPALVLDDFRIGRSASPHGRRTGVLCTSGGFRNAKEAVFGLAGVRKSVWCSRCVRHPTNADVMPCRSVRSGRLARPQWVARWA